MSMVYTNRVAELGAIPSTGTVGDSYDNSMAEAVNALYKAELIRQQGPWRTVEQVEFATLKYVWWWNNNVCMGNSICAPLQKWKRRTTLTLNRCRNSSGNGQTGRN